IDFVKSPLLVRFGISYGCTCAQADNSDIRIGRLAVIVSKHTAERAGLMIIRKRLTTMFSSPLLSPMDRAAVKEGVQAAGFVAGHLEHAKKVSFLADRSQVR